MPYQLQPYNYVSMFQPADLGVIQRGLEQRQGRYDAANQAWAETKNALYSDPTYDPKEKDRIIKAVEGNFENIYKGYQGDLGAATGDLMQMIGGIRKDPYFSLNQVALQKQKEFDTLRQQYGAQGLVFSPMKKGLRDEHGNLRKQEDFNYDIVKDLERDEKLAQIIDQSLKEVSEEGPLGGGSGVPGLLMSVTKGSKGYKQNKNESIYEEYKNTPEGKLHLRILREHPEMRSKTPEADLKLYVDQMIANRTAPPSVRRDYMQDPSFKLKSEETNTPIPQDIYTVEQTTVKTGGEKMFNDSSDILKNATSNDMTPKKDIAYQKLKKVSSRPEFVRMRQEIDKVLNVIKANKSDYIKLGELTYSDHDKKYNPKLVEKIDNYNSLLKEQLELEANAFDYRDAKWTHVDRNKAYRTGGKSYETYADETMKNTVNEIRRIGLNGFIFEDSPFANKKEYDDTDYEKFSNVTDAQFTFDTKNGMFAIKVNTNDGKSHIALPKSLSSAVSLARAYGHPEAIKAAVMSNIEFVENVPRYYKKVDGVPTPFPLPQNIVIDKISNGNFVVKDTESNTVLFGATDKYTLAKALAKFKVIDEPELID